MGRRVAVWIALSLTNDLLRIFVFADSKKDRLPQFPIARPLREFDLRHELRIHPVHFLHYRRSDSLNPGAALFRWKIDKWTIVTFLRAKFLVQDRQRLFGETASDFSGEL